MTDTQFAGLAAFVAEMTGVNNLSESTPLVSAGLIDSMGLMEVILFIEEQTGVELSPSEMEKGDFESLGHIRRFVDRIQNRQPQ